MGNPAKLQIFIPPFYASGDVRNVTEGGLAMVAAQERIELILPRADLRRPLPFALIGERRLIRSENLVRRVTRQMKVPADLPDLPPLSAKSVLNRATDTVIASTFFIPSPSAWSD